MSHFSRYKRSLALSPLMVLLVTLAVITIMSNPVLFTSHSSAFAQLFEKEDTSKAITQ